MALNMDNIPSYEEFLKQIKINLWLAGIPYGSEKINLRFYFLAFPMIVIVSAESAYFGSRISGENLLELTQLAPCICVGTLSTLKICAMARKRQKIFKLTESLGELYKNILKENKKITLIKQDLVALNILMKYFFVLNTILITVYNFSTLLLSLYQYFTKYCEWNFKLPYEVLLPFSTNAWIPYTVVYTYSVLCGFICVLHYTTADGLYFVLTSHVCANYSVICNTIRELDANNVHLLKEIIRDHQYILKLGEDLEDIFMASNLFNVLIGSLEICALGFNLTTGSWDRAPGYVLFLLSVLLQILMMSVFGENLITQSRNIGDAAFLCNWLEMDQISKKIILTIMIRSRKPQRLTAYKFSVISYGSFTKIISTSWSYFTILRTVYTPQIKSD